MIWTSTLGLTTLILQLLYLRAAQNIDPDVLLDASFPPAEPSLMNLNAICIFGNHRARFSSKFLPPSSYAYARRAGNAVNRLEAWFIQCCHQGVATENNQILCCAKQAWKNALSLFCVEEFSTMTLAHECCEENGENRWKCFTKQAPNPFYQPRSGYLAPLVPLDRVFTWDPKTC